jgi:HAD superfamily hydrolase (TIGR01490 family)
MKKLTIAAFDFDGTVTRKDTLLEFIKFSKGRVKFYLCILLFAPLLVAMKLKLLPNWKVKQLVFTYLYKGVSIEIFNKYCLGFCAVIDKLLRYEAMEALRSHQKRNNRVIIISASIENWIKPWADNMGIDIVLATKIEIDKNGLLTGKFLTKNCYGQEKITRLLEAFPDRNDYKLVVYGDSRGDKELIRFADNGFYKKFH